MCGLFLLLIISDTISIEQSIAQTFQLRSYKDVIVRKTEDGGERFRNKLHEHFLS